MSYGVNEIHVYRYCYYHYRDAFNLLPLPPYVPKGMRGQWSND